MKLSNKTKIAIIIILAVIPPLIRFIFFPSTTPNLEIPTTIVKSFETSSTAPLTSTQEDIVKESIKEETETSTLESTAKPNNVEPTKTQETTDMLSLGEKIIEESEGEDVSDKEVARLLEEKKALYKAELVGTYIAISTEKGVEYTHKLTLKKNKSYSYKKYKEKEKEPVSSNKGTYTYTVTSKNNRILEKISFSSSFDSDNKETVTVKLKKGELYISPAIYFKK